MLVYRKSLVCHGVENSKHNGLQVLVNRWFYLHNFPVCVYKLPYRKIWISKFIRHFTYYNREPCQRTFLKRSIQRIFLKRSIKHLNISYIAGNMGSIRNKNTLTLNYHTTEHARQTSWIYKRTENPHENKVFTAFIHMDFVNSIQTRNWFYPLSTYPSSWFWALVLPPTKLLTLASTYNCSSQGSLCQSQSPDWSASNMVRYALMLFCTGSESTQQRWQRENGREEKREREAAAPLPSPMESQRRGFASFRSKQGLRTQFCFFYLGFIRWS